MFLLILCVNFGTLGADENRMPSIVGPFLQEMRTFYSEQDGLADVDVQRIAIDSARRVYARTESGDFEFRNGQWAALGKPTNPFRTDMELDEISKSAGLGQALSVARDATSTPVYGTTEGLFFTSGAKFEQQFPEHGNRRWAPTNVRVDYDGLGRLWFCSKQGVGCFADGEWTLHTGADGLPYDDLTSIACSNDGTVWCGTTKGVVRFDGQNWAYRQGKRWLPNDDVRDIAIDADGNAWIATAGGIAFIYFKPMTLAEKAEYYETEIDRFHRRTKFGYVIEAHAPVPGGKQNLRLGASDNDGLWTSMYGAGECFAYGATKSPESKQRAKRAFEALRFLSEAPKGSKHAPPDGFIARTVLETTAPDPNLGSYTLEAQRRFRSDDGYWRVYEPRWPKSADGEYYWKSDTSSDELDGH
ncbi:MAG: hypothetical protein KDB27_20405, partial [Planctomycetales bacterium]|nr:hypothetical protein [Planctomycetales bacterium]